MADVQWGEESATALAVLSAAELHPGPTSPGWQIYGVGKTLP